MSAVDEILSRVPIQQLAAQLGTDEQTARSAAQSAATQLLGGLAGNAQDPQGEVSLASALSDHARSNHLLDADTVDLGAVDEQDADKILVHVFADPQVAALQHLARQGRVEPPGRAPDGVALRHRARGPGRGTPRWAPSPVRSRRGWSRSRAVRTR